MTHCKICKGDVGYIAWPRHVNMHKREYIEAKFGKNFSKTFQRNFQVVCWACVLEFNKVEHQRKHTCKPTKEEKLISQILSIHRTQRSLREYDTTTKS